MKKWETFLNFACCWILQSLMSDLHSGGESAAESYGLDIEHLIFSYTGLS